jgi:glutamine amidotransferase
MIAVIDYGLGNLFSLKSSLDYIGLDNILTSDKDVIRNADAIILPGVGAFRDAISKLKEDGLYELLIEQANSEKPFLGICLGMQLLFEKSYEYGEYEGLGLISGEIRSIKEDIDESLKNLKIPHMGWNNLKFNYISKNDPILNGVNEDEYVYFVHSYYASTPIENVITYSNYGVKIPGVVRKNNVYGMQFHPEKSSDTGLKLLKNWGKIIENR